MASSEIQITKVSIDRADNTFSVVVNPKLDANEEVWVMGTLPSVKIAGGAGHTALVLWEATGPLDPISTIQRYAGQVASHLQVHRPGVVDLNGGINFSPRPSGLECLLPV